MITIANANALHIPLPDQSVQCVVTSPPYWGLRDYGTAKWEGGSAECDHRESDRRNVRPNGAFHGGDDTAQTHPYRDICPRCGARRIDAQIGLESTPAAYVAHIVAVIRECWRVLKDDGVLWLNLGDSYAQGGNEQSFRNATNENWSGGSDAKKPRYKLERNHGLKPKDLCGIPWRVAFALQDDGWYLRSDVIWAKPNPMPESVTDRPTKAHEYVFLLTKQARYYYDAEAIREDGPTYTRKAGGYESHDVEMPDGEYRRAKGFQQNDVTTSGRNRRSVWTVATQPYSGAHFATFPPALIEPMILAGTSARGECPQCGKAWVRVVEKTGERVVRYSATNNGPYRERNIVNEFSTVDWRPQCDCRDLSVCIGDHSRDCLLCDNTGFMPMIPEPVPQTVLDPFAGSGTTGAVAVKHGRKAVLLDLNTKYIDLQFDRVDGVQMVMSV